MFFDSDIPGVNRLTFIGQDPFRSGMLAAKLMNMLIQDQGSIAIVRILPQDFHIEERTRGFHSYFKTNKLSTQLHTYDWEEQVEIYSILDIISQILAEKKDLKGIFVTNALTYPIAAYLDSHPQKEKINIIGYDLIKENVDYLKHGVIDFLISQSPITQGYQGIQNLYRYLVLKQEVADKIWMPIDIVTQENIDFYQYN
jgi:LacI family transcriptional regulator